MTICKVLRKESVDKIKAPMCESDQTIPATHDDAIALLNSIRHLRQYVLQPADSSASISLLQAPETHGIFEPSFSRACSLGIFEELGLRV